MTLLSPTSPINIMDVLPNVRENEDTSVMVRVMVPIRRANRFWQMLRDESKSDFSPFGTYESADIPSHRLMVAELTGKPKEIAVDLNMFPKYHFTATVVDSLEEALAIPGFEFSKTERYSYSDPELDLNKKKSQSTSAFG